MSNHWYCDRCGMRVRDDAPHLLVHCLLFEYGIEDPYAWLDWHGWTYNESEDMGE